MRYKTPKALEQAIKTAAAKSGRDTNRAIAGFYHDRFLCRVFATDEPICNRNDDLLDRADFADKLANALCSAAPTTAPLVIGLYGPWGSGKTSVVNLVAKQLEERHDVIADLRFEPWNYLTSSQLVEQFFYQLAQSLKLAKVRSNAALGASFQRHNLLLI